MEGMISFQEAGNTALASAHIHVHAFFFFFFFYRVPILFSKWIVIEHYFLFPLFRMSPKAV